MSTAGANREVSKVLGESQHPMAHIILGSIYCVFLLLWLTNTMMLLCVVGVLAVKRARITDQTRRKELLWSKQDVFCQCHVCLSLCLYRLFCCE
jgi:type IV secretory pathway VirB3-like protein